MEQASGLLTYFYRIVGRRLPDFLRIFTRLWGGGFRIVYGFFPNFGEEASGLLTYFYRIVGRRPIGLFTDFFRILGGFRFVYGFFPDFGEEASGLLTEFDRTSGLCTDFNRILG